jgi:hypothetical protein
MANVDVFVAFVREDQPFAEAIAIALQDAGLTVSRSASVMEAIDASPAVVVLWTPASSRSRLFLDAADRAFRAGKMVLARLGGAPTPAEYGSALHHDFNTWSGDPDHTELNVIVAHVLRMAEFVRGRAAASGYGAASVHPFPGQQPHQQRPPAYVPAAPPSPEARLLEEAAFWRQVQANGGPADYRAYLDRYGASGQFSDVAALRLQQLSVPPPPPPPIVRPQPSRFEPDRFEPDRNPAERAAPPRRGLEFDRPVPDRGAPDRPAPERAPERSFRHYETPPPPKSGAGIAATLFLLILGGLAAGGWFIYNGGSFLPVANQRDPVENVGPAVRTPIQPADAVSPPETDARAASPDPGPRSGGAKGADEPATPPAPKAAPKPPAPQTKAAPAKAAPPPAEPETDLNTLERDRLARTLPPPPATPEL